MAVDILDELVVAAYIALVPSVACAAWNALAKRVAFDMLAFAVYWHVEAVDYDESHLVFVMECMDQHHHSNDTEYIIHATK